MRKRLGLLLGALLATTALADRASAADFWLSGYLTIDQTTSTNCWVVFRGATSASPTPGQFTSTITSGTFSSANGAHWSCGVFVTPLSFPWPFNYVPSHVARPELYLELNDILGSCGGWARATESTLSTSPTDGQVMNFHFVTIPGSPSNCTITGWLAYSTSPPL